MSDPLYLKKLVPFLPESLNTSDSRDTIKTLELIQFPDQIYGRRASEEPQFVDISFFPFLNVKATWKLLGFGLLPLTRHRISRDPDAPEPS